MVGHGVFLEEVKGRNNFVFICVQYRDGKKKKAFFNNCHVLFVSILI